MTQHDDRVRLLHMLDYSRKAAAMIQGRTREDLNQDEILSLALTRVVEIIGEAAARVSPAFQQNHSSIPWPQIIGLRNRLVHGYDAVDLDILWNIVLNDLPPLVNQVEGVIDQIQS
jgi:uncharacterized protein with HEPN domain